MITIAETASLSQKDVHTSDPDARCGHYDWPGSDSPSTKLYLRVNFNATSLWPTVPETSPLTPGPYHQGNTNDRDWTRVPINPAQI